MSVISSSPSARPRKKKEGEMERWKDGEMERWYGDGANLETLVHWDSGTPVNLTRR